MAGFSWIFLQLSAQPGNVSVDRSAAHRSAGPPDLPQELQPRGNGSAASHERQQEPELGTGYPHRLAAAQDRLGGWLQENASETDCPGQTGGGPGRQPPGLLKQLLYSCDQLTHHGGIRVSGSVEVCRTSSAVTRLSGLRCGDLKLVDDRPGIGANAWAFSRELRRPCKIRFDSGFVLVVNDENSRNASIVGGRRCTSAQHPPGAVVRGVRADDVQGHCMTVTTPAGAELLEGYDRLCWPGQEQIGSGMPLGIPEAPDRWYEVKERGS